MNFYTVLLKKACIYKKKLITPVILVGFFLCSGIYAATQTDQNAFNVYAVEKKDSLLDTNYGNLYYIYSINKFAPQGSWAKIESQQVNSGFFKKVAVGHGDGRLWVLSSENKLYFRNGISANAPAGAGWVRVYGADSERECEWRTIAAGNGTLLAITLKDETGAVNTFESLLNQGSNPEYFMSKF
jgi:hypothetical protein